MDEQIEWETSRREWNASCCAHTRARAHAHTGTRACTRQRRTTLVVDLQDKYYSEKLDYRYRPPPSANSCASADPPDVPIPCNVRGCGRVWKTFEAITPPPPESFLLLQHSISRFSLLRARPRYLTNFFFFSLRYISTTRNDVAPVMVNAGKPLAPEIRVYP